MKNIRNIAIVVAAFGAVAANAQSFELRAGTGATLQGNTFVVNPGTGSFEVQVWANFQSQRIIDGWSVALAFDTTTGSGTSAVRSGGPLDVTGVTRAAQFASWNGGVPTINQKRGAANSSAGSNSNLVSPRAYVSFNTLQIPAGVPADDRAVVLNGSVHVLTATISYNLANGNTFGDALSEAGLFVFNQGGTGAPGGGASGNFGSATIPAGPAVAGRYGSGKYQVQAVPEPATMAALAAGVAALAARRRKKA